MREMKKYKDSSLPVEERVRDLQTGINDLGYLVIAADSLAFFVTI